MNTELENKKGRLEYLYKMRANSRAITDNYSKLIDDTEKEIAELTEPLSFLQLAEKWDKRLYKSLWSPFAPENCVEIYVNKMECDLGLIKTQARKFVAEIYLTLLAKELNPENWEADYSENCNVKVVPGIWYETGELNGTEYPSKYKVSNLTFEIEAWKKALTYSPEAVTMWNWYFGKEEGK